MPEIVHLPKTASTASIHEILARDGGVIVDDVLDAATVDRLLAELRPYLDRSAVGIDAFGGYKTARTGALVARSKTFRELVVSDMPIRLAESFLRKWTTAIQLHVTQVIRIQPEEGEQQLHRDLAVWSPHLLKIPAIEPQLNSMWALTDFLEKNGATQVVPGSNHWDLARIPEEHEIAYAEMRRGSVLFFSGRTIHGGGRNRTSTERIGMLLDYALGWLRQEENQYLCCPAEIARTYAPELQALLGYARGNFGLGYYSDPYDIVPNCGLLPPELAVGGVPKDDMSWPDEYAEDYVNA